MNRRKFALAATTGPIALAAANAAQANNKPPRQMMSEILDRHVFAPGKPGPVWDQIADMLRITGPIIHKGCVVLHESGYVHVSAEPFIVQLRPGISEDGRKYQRLGFVPWRNNPREASRRLRLPLACNVEVPA